MYSIIRRHSTAGVKDYVVDTQAELTELDCGMGSSALVLENMVEYIKNGKDEWIEKPKTGGGADVDPESLKSFIQAVSTEEEMDAILTGATEETVGRFFIYVGETTEKYENGAIYQVAEEASEG